MVARSLKATKSKKKKEKFKDTKKLTTKTILYGTPCLLSPRSENVEIIRIYHEFVDMIDYSVLRVTAWHHEALPSDGKQ